MEKIRWERLAAIVICLGALFLIASFFLRIFLSVILPFAIAWLAALLLRPTAIKLAERFHLPKKLCAVVLPILVIIGVIGLLYWAAGRLIAELQRLLERLLENAGSFSGQDAAGIDFFEILTSRVPLFHQLGVGERFSAFHDSFNHLVSDLLTGLLETLSTAVPGLAGRLISALPDIFLVSLITVISLFYFCIEGDRITAAAIALLPRSVQERLPEWKRRLKRFSWRYLRAYLLLLLLTFAELFFGFSILRLDYAFLLAAVIALVDMLPILGVGTVLLPWAAVCLLQKNFYVGFGLLILYFAVLVLRQIMEPRLVGHTLGLHPLMTLFWGYAGWRIFGFWGMLLGPLVAALLKLLTGQLQIFSAQRRG